MTSPAASGLWPDAARAQQFQHWLAPLIAAHALLPDTLAPASSDASSRRYLRLRTQAGDSLPAGIQPQIGPVTTGLGEVYMYSVEYANPGGKGAKVRDGQTGWQSDGAYLTPDLLGGPDSQMIANVIERQFKRANDWPFGAAMSFLLMYLTFIAIAIQAVLAKRTPEAKG